MTSIPTRRFTKVKKAWSISLEGETCVTRDGAAAPKKKKHKSREEALEDYVAKVSAKLWEGWVEEIASGRPAPPMPELAPADLETQRARLREIFEGAKLPHCARAIDACVKPALAVRLRRMDEGDLEVGASRFGGHPDLPPKTPWPAYVDAKTKRERPLDFVCQLRLEDLAPLDESKLLPRAGLLSFFVLGDWDADNPREPDYLSVCRVLHAPSAQRLERRPLPAAYARTSHGERVREPYRAHAVEAFPILTLPPSGNRAFKKLGVKPDEYGAVFEASQAFEQWLRRRFPGIRGTRVLGYRNRDADREPKQVLLLQSETDYSTDMRWGDADFLYYWIAPSALAKARFDGVTSNYAD